MTQSEFIAVVDLGTSKITCVVGRKNEDGGISVLHHETIDSENSIRRGLVYNIENTGGKIDRVVRLMENKMGHKIGQIYVSLSGQSLQTLEFKELRQLYNGIVEEDDVNALIDSANSFNKDLLNSSSLELRYNYLIGDVEYFIDGKSERHPVGVTGKNLEGVFQLIVGRPNLLTNIKSCASDKAKIPLAGFIVGAIASSKIVLTEEDKELGCALIDFGAGTTTLSIYKEGMLRRMVVIPFGGKNITKDIMALQLMENEAERLKIKYGQAAETRTNSFFESPFSSKSEVDVKELNRVIGLRLDEIVANVKEQIILSGYQDKLASGAVIIGGASKLKNLDVYLKQKLNMPIRKGVISKGVINNANELVNDPAFTQVLGMLLIAEKNCAYNEPVKEESPIVEEHEETQKSNKSSKKTHVGKDTEKPKDSSGKFMNKVEGFFGRLFTEE